MGFFCVGNKIGCRGDFSHFWYIPTYNKYRWENQAENWVGVYSKGAPFTKETSLVSGGIIPSTKNFPSSAAWQHKGQSRGQVGLTYLGHQCSGNWGWSESRSHGKPASWLTRRPYCTRCLCVDTALRWDCQFSQLPITLALPDGLPWSCWAGWTRVGRRSGSGLEPGLQLSPIVEGSNQ